eukprot:TRINITY_DN18293_c0_g3_i1.p1 TRINITY_DN18293_c0_g3~~TRINITY_DN18293_c0_g3_i1.p1  ORF type:complete len:1055 (-),score=215.11 TRINITY_DN18293_c0_g3_i1:64-3228(-)
MRSSSSRLRLGGEGLRKTASKLRPGTSKLPATLRVPIAAQPEAEPLLGEEARAETAQKDPVSKDAGDVYHITINGEELADLSVLVRYLPGVGMIFFVNYAIFWGLVVSAPFVFDRTLECETGVPGSANIFFLGICTSSVFLELMAAYFSVRGQRLLLKRKAHVLMLLMLGAFGRFDAYSDITFISIARKCHSRVWPFSAAIFFFGVIIMQMIPGFVYLIRFVFYNGDPYKAIMCMDMHILLETIDPTELAQGEIEVDVSHGDLELPENTASKEQAEAGPAESRLLVESESPRRQKDQTTAASQSQEPGADQTPAEQDSSKVGLDGHRPKLLFDGAALQEHRGSMEKRREDTIEELKRAIDSGSVLEIQDALALAYKAGLDPDNCPELQMAVKTSNDLLFTKVLAGRIKIVLGLLRFCTEDLLQGICQVFFLTDAESEKKVSDSNRFFTLASVSTGVLVSFAGPLHAWYSQWSANRQVGERVKLQLRTALGASNLKKIEPRLMELQRIITPGKALAKKVEQTLRDIDYWKQMQTSPETYGLIKESLLVSRVVSILQGNAPDDTLETIHLRRIDERENADDDLRSAIAAKSTDRLLEALNAAVASKKLLDEAKQLLGEEEKKKVERDAVIRTLVEATRLRDKAKIMDTVKAARALGIGDAPEVKAAESALRDIEGDSDDEEEDTSLVISMGAGSVQAGTSGEDAPKSVFENLVNVGQDDCSVVGDPSSKAVLGSRLIYPMNELGYVQDWDALEKVFHHTFYNELRVAPEDHPVLMTEPVLNPKVNREKITQIMFETFNVPAFYLVQTSVLGLYASGRTTGLHLDARTGCCDVTPVYEGYVLPHAVMRTHLGGIHLAGFLNVLLGRAQKKPLSYQKITEEVFAKGVLYVAADYGQELGKRIDDLATSVDQDCVLDMERFMCPEILFQPSILEDAHAAPLLPPGADTWKPSGEQLALPELVCRSIMKCDIDVRRDLYDNLILCGGLSLLEGLPKRLESEMASLAPAGTRIKIIAPPERRYSHWIGGSILGSLTSFQSMWVSKLDYDEAGPSVVHRKCF